MLKKCLVIGSNSFSGSNFVNYLLAKNYIVYGVSRSNEIHNIFLPYKKNKNLKNFFFNKFNINTDLNKILFLIKKNQIPYIANFAAQGMVAESWKYPLDWYNTNIISQIKLIEGIQNFSFIKKYFHVSTPEVYGSFSRKIKESFNFNPSTPYAISRSTTDFHLHITHQNKKFPVVFSRAANVYGPGQQLYRIIPRSIYTFNKSVPIFIDGGGKSLRSFVHIEDVVEAYYKIMKKGKIGETYHVSSNRFISIKSLVLKISRLINSKNKNLIIYNADDRIGKDHAYMLDSNKIRNNLKWNDKINLDFGLNTCVKWFLENEKFIKKEYITYNHKK